MLQSGSLTGEVTAVTAEDNLVAAARRGDVEAFGKLFERHKDTVYAFVYKSIGRREDAEDIVQDTFRKAWLGIAGFRGGSSILTWLCRIAMNLCADRARSARMRVDLACDSGVDPDELGRMNGPQANVEADVITRWRVESALGTLPISHRMLVVLCDIQGFSCSEAARIMGCTVMSVRARLFRARQKLRHTLADLVEEVN